VLEQLGAFRYEDEQSEQMLKRSGAQPQQQKPLQHLLEQQNFERYTGEWVGKQRHGRGKSVTLDGSTYEGYWMHDKKNGLGRMVHIDGSAYLGYWKDDMMHGMGTYSHNDGARYEGEW